MSALPNPIAAIGLGGPTSKRSGKEGRRRERRGGEMKRGDRKGGEGMEWKEREGKGKGRERKTPRMWAGYGPWEDESVPWTKLLSNVSHNQVLMYRK